MRVLEKESDRTADVYVHVDGESKALSEYGEYVDEKDKAICCYVPVELDTRLILVGKFSGTTSQIVSDAVVDGVYRKVDSYTPKTVSFLKNRKVGTRTFLYKSGKEIIDTDMSVALMTDTIVTKGCELETVGTIELRLYVARQVDTEYIPENIEKYYECTRKAHASYTTLAPTFQMAFNHDGSDLEKPQKSRMQRRMDAERPGTEPWAIFRFHYRTQEAIVKHNLPLTFDPASKSPSNRTKTSPYGLQLEPVPQITADMTVRKGDDESSTRASTPMTSNTPSIRANSAQKEPIAQKRPLQPNSATSKAAKMSFSTPDIALATEKNPLSVASTSVLDSHSFLERRKSTEMTPKPTKQHTKALGQNILEKQRSSVDDTIAVSIPKQKPTDWNNASKAFWCGVGAFDSTKPTKTPKKDPIVVIQQAPKPSTIPTVKMAEKTQKPPSASPPLFVPEKRAGEDKPESESPTKRAKVETPPPTPITPSKASRIASSIVTPQPLSIERQVAEQRKKLQALRLKRAETAKKREEAEKDLAPFKQRMAEELERLKQEMMEEEAAAAEDEEHLDASIQMLAEFKKGSGDA